MKVVLSYLQVPIESFPLDWTGCERYRVKFSEKINNMEKKSFE